MKSHNLDFVRACAVLLVMLSHLFLFWGNHAWFFVQPALLGPLGVMFFFVHSGCVNLFSIQRHVEKCGDHRLTLSFMTRRACRILPLSIVMVSLLYFTNAPTGSMHVMTIERGQHLGVRELVANLLLVQNFIKRDQLLGPLWSLPYELQIYCIFPLMFLLCRKSISSQGLLFIWVTGALANVLIAPRLEHFNSLHQYYLVPNLLLYSLYFLPGIFAFRASQQTRRSLPFWLLPLLLLCGAIAWMLTYDRLKGQFICLALGLALPHFEETKTRWLCKASAWVAQYSYGIYLMHVPAMWIAFMVGRPLPLPAQWLAFVALTFGGSMIGYHLIEHPLIQAGNTLARTISTRSFRTIPGQLPAGN
ncbi:MAG: acyltransferase, partial [Bryobacteraceae bacterium]